MKTSHIAFTCILSLLLTAVSCNKEQGFDPEGPELTFRAVGAEEAESKTALRSDGFVVWEPQDEIMVYYGNQSGKFTSTNTSRVTTAEFKGRLGNLVMNDSQSFLGVYPYSAARSNDVNSAGDGFSAYLPFEQTAVEGGFADDLFLSAGRSLNFDLYFYNLCGGVKFTLSEPNVKRIAFSANGNESLAGTGYFDYPISSVPTYSHAGSDARARIVLSAPNGETFKTGVWYYMVAFPVKLSKGFTIDLYSSTNLIGTIKSDKPVEIRRARWGILKELSAPVDPPVSLEAVDLGLSVKWANINLGATALNDYGNYYSWGETQPENGNYTWSNYQWGSPTSGFKKYSREQGKTVLDPEDDAATQALGDKWRMATIEEFRELVDKCDWERTSIDGVTCYKVTGSNGQFIYFPAYPGYYDGGITERGVNGYYWSSTIMTSNWQRAQNLWFKNGIEINTGERYYGEVIRPVYGDRASPSLRSNPNTLDFGTVAVGSSASQTVQVTNEGAAGTKVEMNIPEGFSVNPSSDVYINAKETKSFTITFSPTEAKDYSGYLTFGFDGGVSFVTISAMGEAAGYVKPEIVDLGLSSKWASFNLGATSPEQTGALFAWGEVESKTYFSWDNYRWGREDAPTKYKNGQGVYALLSEDDAATQILGEGWRMPTSNDFWELYAYCSWSKTTKNGVSGYNISRNGKTIFLPSPDSDELHYWTASVAGNLDSKAHANGWSNDYGRWLSWFDFRYIGNVIRPVYGAGMTSFSLLTYSIPKDFGEVPVGESVTQTLRFTNSGNHRTVLTYSSHPDGFSCDFVSGTVLEPGVTVEVNFVFTPTREKSYSGTFRFNEDQKAFNGNTKYMEFTLTGKGVKPADPHPDAIDLGLSVRWADHNVGATTPEGYGKFYAWGETSSKNTYDWSTYKWGSDMYSLTKYCFLPAYGTNDGKRTLEKADDAASVNWSSDWRTPTYAEFEELLNNCTWTWTSVNGVKGYKVTSKKNSNSIFLPATGHITDSEPSNVGETGFYWTAELSGNPAAAAGFYMYSSQKDFMNYMRYFGLCVRPVLDGSSASSAPIRIPFRKEAGTEPLGISQVSNQ